MPSLRDGVKPYFVTGAYPTQSQFWELLDKLVFKDEGVSRLEGLGQASIDIPGNTWIDKIGIVTSSDLVVSIGTVPGGNDVFDSEQVASPVAGLAKDIFFQNAGALYFTGILANTKIIIFIR